MSKREKVNLIIFIVLVTGFSLASIFYYFKIALGLILSLAFGLFIAFVIAIYKKEMYSWFK